MGTVTQLPKKVTKMSLAKRAVAILRERNSRIGYTRISQVEAAKLAVSEAGLNHFSSITSEVVKLIQRARSQIKNEKAAQKRLVKKYQFELMLRDAKKREMAITLTNPDP